MKIQRLETGAIGANAYIISDGEDCLVIDPGGEDAELFAASLEKATGVFLTHGHADHIAGVAPYNERGIPLYIGEEDSTALTDARANLSVWLGMPFALEGCRRLCIARDGDTITVGKSTFRVITAPGHSPGSVCLCTDGHVFTGDVLFASGVGRTDLPGGDAAALAESIREKLFALPDDTEVHPGHGPETTIGAEKRNYKYFFGEDTM
jgi:glyoxylase-like metal-dependent hydrolase (beta-lactamase superfamily II)